MWAGIMLDGRTNHHICEKGSITARTKENDKLEHSGDTIRLSLLFMDDDASHLYAHLVDNFLTSEDIQRME